MDQETRQRFIELALEQSAISTEFCQFFVKVISDVLVCYPDDVTLDEFIRVLNLNKRDPKKAMGELYRLRHHARANGPWILKKYNFNQMA